MIQQRLRRMWPVLAILLAVLAAVLLGRGWWSSRGFTEYRMPTATDIPTAIAVAPDGSVWFTIEFSDAIGMLRNGKLEKLPKGKQNVEPVGLAVAADGAAWYTDAPSRLISRISPAGAITSFPLSTPMAASGSSPSPPTVRCGSPMPPPSA